MELTKNDIGFPKTYFKASLGTGKLLVLDHFPVPLYRLILTAKERLTIELICIIMEQVITRLETIHSKGYLMLDLKPDNLGFKTADCEELFVTGMRCVQPY